MSNAHDFAYTFVRSKSYYRYR